jgi:hypothetical protein
MRCKLYGVQQGVLDLPEGRHILTNGHSRGCSLLYMGIVHCGLQNESRVEAKMTRRLVTAQSAVDMG